MHHLAATAPDEAGLGPAAEEYYKKYCQIWEEFSLRWLDSRRRAQS